ncbi:cytochrome b [Gymnodinialimonas sp. 2305UL16-5]
MQNGYGRISRFNHWVTAAAFLIALGIGLVIGYGGLGEEQVFALYAWHMLFGAFVLAYGFWRVAWRMANGFPEPTAPRPRWQEAISKAVHVALLTIIVAMPVSGILMTISGGFDVILWGVILIPSIGEVGWLNRATGAVHGITPFAILGLLILHVGAALKHHFIDRDGTLVRMTSGRKGHS